MMKLKNSLIPLTYFPSDILLLDDDTDFLESIKNRFRRTRFNGRFHLFEYADDVLEWVAEHSESTASQCLDFEESYPGSRAFDVLNQFKNFPQHNTALHCASLVIMDYAMPSKDGLTFAKELREIAPEVKILMLTGEADNTIAIDAFNDGLIDLFIKKETRNLSRLLLESAQKLVIQYFLDQTNAVLANIDPTEECGLPAFLKHQDACAHLLTQFPLEDCKSFCLINEAGTFEVHLKQTEAVHYFKLLNDTEYDHMIEDLKENVDEDTPIFEKAKEKVSLILQLPSGQDMTADVQKIIVDGIVYYFAECVKLS